KAKTQTKATGTDKAAYPQIEDAPPKEEFDIGKFAKNILAGLAVVGAVTAVAAATVATGGAALAALGAITTATASAAFTGTIAGALLGGITLLGIQAVGDIKRGEVSDIGEYTSAAFRGAVTGAIGGVIPGGKLIGIGVGGVAEGIADRKLKGEKNTAEDMIRDFFVSMVTAGVLDGVARKIGSTQAYKVVKEKVGKQIKKIFKPVVDTFNRGVKKVIPEGLAFSPSKIDDTLGKESKNFLSNFKKNFKDIVTGSGKESVEKAATKETKLIANNTNDVVSFEVNKSFNSYSGDLMLPKESARYSEYWREKGIGSDNTWKAFSVANPDKTIDDYFKLVNEMSPWPIGKSGTPKLLQSGDRFYMAVQNDAPNNMIGGFGVKEKIISTQFVRENLAVKSDWKKTCNVIREFEVNDGISLNVLEGPVGPQVDLTIDSYLPGDMTITQYDLFSGLDHGINREDYIHIVDEFWVD
ncbi:MAG: hypothetical protein ACTTKP_11175, partial [Catonella sp.]